MNRISQPTQMSVLSKKWHDESKTVGFVPTMGFLHAGHISLIDRAREECDVVVVSIFVNPTQFGPNEDLDNYPRDIENDTQLCEKAGVDVIFYPQAADMYPQNDDTVSPEYPELTTKLCGEFRPGHFDGVLTIMTKLLAIVLPDRCYMGKKDGQQLVLVQKMAGEYFPDCEIIGCPLIREESGLALSSRNTYLSDDERARAITINIALENFVSSVFLGAVPGKDIDVALKEATDELRNNSLDVQYFELVERKTFKPAREIVPGEYLLCVAAKCGVTRLIDNYCIDVDSNHVISIDRGIKIAK